LSDERVERRLAAILPADGWIQQPDRMTLVRSRGRAIRK
jgi:hypothetical protein